MLQNLYDLNVRKLVVMGLAPIGCAPHYLWQYRSENGECIESINDMVREFNFLMRYMIEELGEELPDSNIIFCDMFEGSMDIIKNHENYGERCCKSLYCFTQKIVFSIVLIQYIIAYVQVLMTLLLLAVGWVSTGVGSCAYHHKWLAVMHPPISGGISFTQLMQ